ncbi:TlpA family protein disulfide reductase [Rhodocyclus purpureus]|uniref:TlpA family protein disulfide reductase n=1 Tax=Rhodocyclus purpureus TaxID=1067 RepID=UPI00191418A7|nr:TlpA disulfide reductase family protein [Rhodocyclus purpureus]MBK5914879.1 hypothetical protein [Rhodocyclus purpureus]
MNRLPILLAGLTIAIAAVLAGLYASAPGKDGSAGKRTEIPADAASAVFASTLVDSDGRPQALAQWRGKTLVINFWAAWCPPCRDEMPGFARLQEKYGADGVQFVGIALDSADNVRHFVAQTPVNYPLLLGNEAGHESASELARAIGNRTLALPYTLIIDAGGRARFARLGYVAEEELENHIKQLLNR